MIACGSAACDRIPCCKACVLLAAKHVCCSFLFCAAWFMGAVRYTRHKSVHVAQKCTHGCSVDTWLKKCGHVAQKAWTRGSKAASRVALEVEGGMFLLSRPSAGSKQEERQAERIPNLLVCRANTTLH
jgi:hypothetical protein